MNTQLMNYQEVAALKKGDRLKVNVDGTYKNATVAGPANGSDAALWIAFDERQMPGGNTIATKVYTGMTFKEEYWMSHKFAHLTEAEQNEEVERRLAGGAL